jgi:hypothetical protein
MSIANGDVAVVGRCMDFFFDRLHVQWLVCSISPELVDDVAMGDGSAEYPKR